MRLIMMGTPVRGTWAALAGVMTLGLWSTSSWQLLPRSRDFLRDGSRLLPLLFERLRTVRGFRPLELLHFLTRAPQLRRLQLVFALRAGE